MIASITSEPIISAPVNIIMVILWVLGGLGLFLYGIEIMGKALRKAAGTALRKGIKALTRTRFHGLATGTVITALMQSSSASTVMVVGFIGAGLLTFESSIGLILGANIGATVLLQITALKVSNLALPCLGIGFVLNYVARKRVWRKIGLAIMGFGMLFFGLVLMQYAVSGYSDNINTWMQARSNGGATGWVLIFLVAMLATAVVQSSAATIGIIQVLAVQGAISDIGVAIPMILGAQVGTCITAILASLKAERSAKRAAVAHLVFNVIGAIVTLVIVRFYLNIIPRIGGDLSHQVANCHLAIKLVNVAMFLPFTGLFAALVKKILPGEDKLSSAPRFLATDDLKVPHKALDNARSEIHRLCAMSVEMMCDSLTALLNSDEQLQDNVLKREDVIDDLYSMITEYILETARGGLSELDSGRPAYLLQVMNDGERIGDHAENIVELAQAYTGDDVRFSVPAKKDLDDVVNMIKKMSALVLENIIHHDKEHTTMILALKSEISDKRREVVTSHEDRLLQGFCSPLRGIVFFELLDNMMSVVSHLRKIAVRSSNISKSRSLGS